MITSRFLLSTRQSRWLHPKLFGSFEISIEYEYSCKRRNGQGPAVRPLGDLGGDAMEGVVVVCGMLTQEMISRKVGSK